MTHIRFICHNIRHDQERHPGEAPWPDRCDLLMAHFQYHVRFVPNAIICLQEPLHHQVQDVLAGLNSSDDTWEHLGVGRDDGDAAGEHVPIFFKPAVFECVEWDTVWLSPEKMQKGWDADGVRVFTIAVFRHRSSDQRFVVGNTHLDNLGIVARREGAKKMVSVMQDWSRRHQDAPVVIMGDFNSQPDGDAYKVVGATYDDVKELCPPSLRYGEEITYTSFGGEEPVELIDYVFVGPREQQPWKVRGYAVLPHAFEPFRVLHSDHRAVVADLELQ